MVRSRELLLLGAAAFLLALAFGLVAAPAHAAPPLPACGDNVDNDGDGRIDYPFDPGCAGFSDTTEETPTSSQCSDGVDNNDSDTLADFPNDPGCTDARDNSEGSTGSPDCSDNVDNDADGRNNYPGDPGCGSASENDETDRECSDAFDNDGDGRVDWPADLGCSSENDTTEIDAPQCNDGRDNDGDGAFDHEADSDCASAADTREGLDPACSDGLDNDGDGAADFPADLGCAFAGDGDETGAVLYTLPVSPTAGPTAGPGSPASFSRRRLLSPFPVVRLRGRVERRRVLITLLTVRAPVGSKVSVYCTGKTCPRKRLTVKAVRRTVRVRRFEKRMRGGTILRVYVTKPGFIGKYTRFRFRSNRVPVRADRCARMAGTKPQICPAA